MRLYIYKINLGFNVPNASNPYRFSVKSILLRTTALRAVVWVVLVPLCWFLFSSDLVGATSSYSALYACLLMLLFFDGIAVAFSNVVDIDCGGLDLIASQYGLEVCFFLMRALPFTRILARWLNLSTSCAVSGRNSRWL